MSYKDNVTANQKQLFNFMIDCHIDKNHKLVYFIGTTRYKSDKIGLLGFIW